MSATKLSRRFAPLGSSSKTAGNVPKLQGVIFDVDGTLCMSPYTLGGESKDSLCLTLVME
jgi:hypothetical protein